VGLEAVYMNLETASSVDVFGHFTYQLLAGVNWEFAAESAPSIAATRVALD
jgi:hypothetical protein